MTPNSHLHFLKLQRHTAKCWVLLSKQTPDPISIRTSTSGLIPKHTCKSWSSPSAEVGAITCIWLLCFKTGYILGVLLYALGGVLCDWMGQASDWRRVAVRVFKGKWLFCSLFLRSHRKHHERRHCHQGCSLRRHR